MEVTETCRQARSVTPGRSSSRSPVTVSSAHSRSRTTSLPSWEDGPPMAAAKCGTDVSSPSEKSWPSEGSSEGKPPSSLWRHT